MPDWTYHPFFKPLLFRLPPEDARALTLRLLAIQARTKLGRRIFRLFGHGPPPREIAVQAFGLTFPSPVGLAPGIDIDGTAVAVMQHLGFGFVTVGPAGDAALLREPGTDPLRITSAHAIARSDSAGGPDVATIAARVAAAPELTIPIGIALRGDLVRALRAAGDRASYHVLPPSAANAEALAELRAATKRPLLLRLHPDWDDARIDSVVDLAKAAGIDGFVATGGATCPLLPQGTMDGPFLRERALAVVERVARKGLPVVGAGGIHTPEDAARLLDAGAKLVELYAGLVYAGPGLPGRIVHICEDRRLVRPAPTAAPEPEPTGRFGWQLVSLTGWILIASGLFALLLAATVKLLPYDVEYLGTTVPELCARNACRIVHFMAHDRVSFGGSITAVGALYVAIAGGPLRRGVAWSWWTLVVSGAVGFASFLTYLGYGYLDVWHGRATIALLPVFVAGLVLSWRTLRAPRGPGALFRVGARAWRWSPAGLGRAGLTFSAFGMIAGGLTIMSIGITRVFVPQDLEYLGTTVSELNALNPRLVPLIAHDRAGFGGGLCSTGLTVMFALWCGARPGARGLWSALCVAGVIGFATAIGVHPIVGYTSFVHLLPAYAGAVTFIIGIILLRHPMRDLPPSDRFPDL
jgi:dihydroorotate dehydrogenase